MAGSGAMKPAALAALLAVALGGCASQSVSIRSVPPENPAAENAAAAESAAAFAAAAALAAEGETDRDTREPKPAPPPITPADAPSMATYDPFERLNRLTYRFNARFDEALFLPVANVYRRIPSDPLRSAQFLRQSVR